MKKHFLPLLLFVLLAVSCKSQNAEDHEPTTEVVEQQEDYDLTGTENEAEDVMEDVLEDIEESDSASHDQFLHSLDGTLWELNELNGKTSGEKIQLQFQAGKISGKTACKQYSSTYLTQGDTISVKEIEESPLDCPQSQSGEIDKAYLEALRQVRTFSVSHGKLTLTNNRGQKLVFDER